MSKKPCCIDGVNTVECVNPTEWEHCHDLCHKVRPKPAAGPFRTDVKNAPTGKPLLCRYNTKPPVYHVRFKRDGKWRSFYMEVSEPDAFAEINTEVPK